MYILSQVLVALSDVFCILSMLSKNKKNVVLFLLISTTLYAGHFCCLSAWTGAFAGLVEIIFLILMYVLEVKQKTKYNVYLSVATMVITIAISILTWAGWISILPMISLIIYLTTMIFNNVIIVKVGMFTRIILNGVYMLLIKSYLGAGLTLVIIAFAIVGLVRDFKNKKKNMQAQATENQVEQDKELEIEKGAEENQ